MSAIFSLALALGVTTCLIVADEESRGDRWIGAVGVAVVVLALLQSGALLWLLNKLLSLAVMDRSRDVTPNWRVALGAPTRAVEGATWRASSND